MRPLVSLAAVLLTAFTASGQSSRIRISLPTFGQPVVMDTLGEAMVVDAPPAKVYTAGRIVLTNYKIVPDLLDSLGGAVGATKLVRSNSVAGKNLSRFLECGSSMTGPRADSHRVTMPIVLLINPSGEGKSTLRIALVASAQDRSGVSSQPVQCGSTGALEMLLRTAIDAQLRELP